jgi:hypothetical protein
MKRQWTCSAQALALLQMLFVTPGGTGAGIEVVLDRHDSLTVACSIYRTRVEIGRLAMLCDRARIVARSDRPDTMP